MYHVSYLVSHALNFGGGFCCSMSLWPRVHDGSDPTHALAMQVVDFGPKKKSYGLL